MAIINDLFKTEAPATAYGRAGLANLYKPANGTYSYVNVTKNYPWTLSESVKETAPRVILKEYQLNETSIRRQYLFYSTAIGNFATAQNGNTPALPAEAASLADFLQPYEELYPKNDKTTTGFIYDLPYFSDINFEVNTPVWASLDTLEQAQKATVGAAGAAAGQGFAGVVDQLINLAGGAMMAGASLLYPKVGIMDRPRLWQSHEFRTINIKFPLFNTHAPDDWKKNRLLCELLVNQNLYNKRDFITSVPPVFYEVLVLGQHYSYASCVTNITIYNRGNMRQINANDDNTAASTYNVPDVYEVNLSLTDMVMPSKNQFQSIQDPTVTSSVVTSEFANSPVDVGSTAVRELGETALGAATGAAGGVFNTLNTTERAFNSINNTFNVFTQ
jgi:hypothetical protein